MSLMAICFKHHSEDKLHSIINILSTKCGKIDIYLNLWT